MNPFKVRNIMSIPEKQESFIVCTAQNPITAHFADRALRQPAYHLGKMQPTDRKHMEYFKFNHLKMLCCLIRAAIYPKWVM